MADKVVVKGKGDGSNKRNLFIAIGFIVLSIAWAVYEVQRPRTEDELREIKENERIQADIERANKKHAKQP